MSDFIQKLRLLKVEWAGADYGMSETRLVIDSIARGIRLHAARIRRTHRKRQRLEPAENDLPLYLGYTA